MLQLCYSEVGLNIVNNNNKKMRTESTTDQWNQVKNKGRGNNIRKEGEKATVELATQEQNLQD